MTFDQVRDEIENLPKTIAVYFWVAELDSYLPFPRYRVDSLPRTAIYKYHRNPVANEATLEIVNAPVIA